MTTATQILPTRSTSATRSTVPETANAHLSLAAKTESAQITTKMTTTTTEETA